LSFQEYKTQLSALYKIRTLSDAIDEYEEGFGLLFDIDGRGFGYGYSGEQLDFSGG
jgi:hypothetical protein